VDPLRPISPTDRTVPAVELTILTPLARDEQRRERERRRRAKTAPKPRPDEADKPKSGIDVRV
jgi:hypothetical protein